MRRAYLYAPLLAALTLGAGLAIGIAMPAHASSTGAATLTSPSDHCRPPGDGKPSGTLASAPKPGDSRPEDGVCCPRGELSGVLASEPKPGDGRPEGHPCETPTTKVPPPKDTPTNTPQPKHTPTNTPQPKHTPTNTPRPKHTPTNTPQPKHTPTTPGPKDTATNTPQPTHTPTNTPPAKATGTHNVPGDVNCDGKVNSLDAVLILQFKVGLIPLRCPKNADVNLDGRINSIDAALILQYDAGLVDHLPVHKT